MLAILGAIIFSLAIACCSYNTFALFTTTKVKVNDLVLQNIGIAISFLMLLIAFITSDFSNKYVGLNSNSNLSLFYKAAATWGGHEGSLLLWVTLLGLFYIYLLKTVSFKKYTYAFKLLNCILLGLLAILAIKSNPFEFANNILDGVGFNPLLRDFAQIIHPPILYSGYVILAIAYAISCNNVIAKANNIKIISKYLYLSTGFITAGITLGSWWAYKVVGWGGWWFWDPVETLSLLPWLFNIIAIHAIKLKKIQSNAKVIEATV